MKKVDMHIHGNFSFDSAIDYKAMCEMAIEKNYQCIAFTEHFDLIDSELAHWGLPPLKRYFNELEIVKKEFPELEVITGIELGEPHRVMDFAERLFSAGNIAPEYIIGSLHVTRSGINVSMKIEKPLTDADIRMYYEENLEMVQKGGFDTLGHLGIYKRGLYDMTVPSEEHVNHIIDEIFREMIKRNIILEVNNSGLKSKYNDLIPDVKTLARYKKMGGELLTISSDSHDLEHFDRFYNKTLDKLNEVGFSCLHWKRFGSIRSFSI